jgi:hypothetical protein
VVLVVVLEQLEGDLLLDELEDELLPVLAPPEQDAPQEGDG